MDREKAIKVLLNPKVFGPLTIEEASRFAVRAMRLLSESDELLARQKMIDAAEENLKRVKKSLDTSAATTLAKRLDMHCGRLDRLEACVLEMVKTKELAMESEAAARSVGRTEKGEAK
jgi:hypothetical protein